MEIWVQKVGRLRANMEFLIGLFKLILYFIVGIILSYTGVRLWSSAIFRSYFNQKQQKEKRDGFTRQSEETTGAKK